jgi:hypothetical protein
LAHRTVHGLCGMNIAWDVHSSAESLGLLSVSIVKRPFV